MEKIATVILCVFLISCGGSSSKDKEVNIDPVIISPPALTVVEDYVIQDTETLLTDIANELRNLDVEEFFETSYKITEERNVETLISDGGFDNLASESIHLFNISDEYAQQTADVQTTILNLLKEYDREKLSEKNRLAFDIYHAHLESQIKRFEFKDFDYPATYGFFGWPGSTEMFFTQAFTITNKAQATGYLTLLNQIGRRFSQIESLLDAREAAGVIEPAVTLRFSQQNVLAVSNTSVTATTYYQAFNDQLSALSTISDDDKTELLTLLTQTIEERVLPAYRSLATKMANLIEKAPAEVGFGQFEGGEEFYAFNLSYYTSGTLDANQIHDLGKQELLRIRQEMNELFTTLNYDTEQPLNQLYDKVGQDAGIIKAEDVQSYYENLIADAYVQLPNAFSMLPLQEVIVVGGASGGYYISGSDDGARPGAFYANTINDQPYTTMPTLAYHEAVPGHHLQIALANEMDLPTFQRKVNFTSFVEGWGLYAERLAKDLGWYSDDIYGDLGRLQYEAMRAARLVVDTGIHVKGWTYEEANQYHIEQVGFPGSIARYSVWPAQATAYMTGMIKILELREKAQNELGNLYNIKDFHAEVIGHGSMPLSILENVINNYIENTINNVP